MILQSKKFVSVELTTAGAGVSVGNLVNKLNGRIIINIDTLIDQQKRLFILHSIKMVLLNNGLSLDEKRSKIVRLNNKLSFLQQEQEDLNFGTCEIYESDFIIIDKILFILKKK